MDLGQQIVIGLSILLAVWFVLASAYNRRRGVSTYRWLQAGLAPLGKLSEAKWIGTSGSGARLVVGKADRPFRRVELVFLLESRELLPLWLFNHYLRQRRDLLILKADLRSAPVGTLLLERARSGPAASAAAAEFPHGLAAAESGRYPDHWRAALAGWLGAYGDSLRRLSIARASPHVILEIYLPRLTVAPGADFFARLGDGLVQLSGARSAEPAD